MVPTSLALTIARELRHEAMVPKLQNRLSWSRPNQIKGDPATVPFREPRVNENCPAHRLRPSRFIYANPNFLIEPFETQLEFLSCGDGPTDDRRPPRGDALSCGNRIECFGNRSIDRECEGKTPVSYFFAYGWFCHCLVCPATAALWEITKLVPDAQVGSFLPLPTRAKPR